ncbi:MAG TPA: transcription elongation factor GreA [Pedococcus sp.]|nr:transcription elongation factor GreA [Pedococcus sp.]
MTQQPSDQNKIWMTQESYDKLVRELEELKGPKRDEVVARISAARDEGDLKENGGYHAAREEQGKLESRIRQLEDTLRNAEVGETPADDGVVEPGMVVVVAFSDGHEQEFLFGAREMAEHHPELDVYSPQSPMGEAINGSKVGDKVSFEGPTGKPQELTVTSAKPFTA